MKRAHELTYQAVEAQGREISIKLLDEPITPKSSSVPTYAAIMERAKEFADHEKFREAYSIVLIKKMPSPDGEAESDPVTELECLAYRQCPARAYHAALADVEECGHTLVPYVVNSRYFGIDS
jgi:hypothetical protein